MVRAPRAALSAIGLLLCRCGGDPATEPPGAADALSPTYCAYEPEEAVTSTRSAASALRAGVGEVPLDMPVGTPLGAYTARMRLLGGSAPDSRQSPYAKAFAPSAGVQARPMARALYLEAGASKLVMIKADLGVGYDRLVYDLEKALAADGSLRGRVIVGTSHSHSAWGTFQGAYHLALGFDLFQESQYQRLLGSLVRAAKAAMTAAQPARLGAGVWDGWDPKDEIFSDRRGDDDKLPGPDGKPIGRHKDNRLLVLRVDDMAQQPLAVLFNFPMHGTIAGEDNPLASVDAPGHVELLLEERFDRPVLAMHLQGPAGDASPRGRGGIGACDEKNKKMLCGDFARMESVGELAAPRIYELWAALQTAPQLSLDVLTRAVADGRAISVRGGMAYAPYDETKPADTTPEAIYTPDGKVRSPITQFNVPVGAGLCGGKSPQLPVAGIEGATGAPYGSCVEIGGAAKFISGVIKGPEPNVPDCPTTRTTMTALRLGGVPLVSRIVEGGGPPVYKQRQDDLLLLTLPGEPLSMLADDLRRQSPAGPERTFVVGYAQGHIGYILGVENWLAGGYEPSINIYGPLEGEYLMEQSLRLGRALWNGEALPAETRGRLAYAPAPSQPQAPGKAEGAGTVPDAVPKEAVLRSRELPAEAQPPQSVARVSGRATFLFYGGDPTEDLPEVTLEREEAPNAFQLVRHRSGRPIGARGRELILIYTPLPVTGDPSRHLWSVEWQAVGWDRGEDSVGLAGALSAPLGRYRFSAKGTAGGKAYELKSRPFTVVAEGALRVEAAASGGKVTGKAVYPVGAGYRLLRLDGDSDGDVPARGVLSVRVQSKADGASQDLTAQAAADGGFEVQPAGLNLGAGVTVTVRDAAGNSGVK